MADGKSSPSGLRSTVLRALEAAGFRYNETLTLWINKQAGHAASHGTFLSMSESDLRAWLKSNGH